jgi:predicted AAA+ superfamily ATPase
MDYDLLINDPGRLPTETPPVLIDEWQRIPHIWDSIRRAVDDGAAPGSFLLTGSIANSDINIHSGAGRIIKRKMFPLSLAERNICKQTVSLGEMLTAEKQFTATVEGESDVKVDRYIYEMAASGLPGIRKYDAGDRKLALESYFDNILSHEFNQQGLRLRQPATLLRWLRAYSAAIATYAGYNEILDVATAGEGHKPAAKTTISYREALSNLWLIDEVTPWIYGEDFFSGLKRSPKHYLADPAFAVYLLGLDEGILSGAGNLPERVDRFDKKYGSILGRLFESLVQLSLNTYACCNNAKLYFIATHTGDREIDFVIQNGPRSIACEVKFAPTVDDADCKHLIWLRNKLGKDLADAMVITTGALAYRRKDGIAVVPAALLGV